MIIKYNMIMRKRTFYSDDSLNPILSIINHRLIELNLSPTKVSRMAGLGSSTLSNMLKRNNSPSVYTLIKICAVLGIKFSAFATNLEDTHPELFALEINELKKYDPYSSIKEHIIEELNALPSKEREETIKRVITGYEKLKFDD